MKDSEEKVKDEKNIPFTYNSLSIIIIEHIVKG